MKPLKLSVSGVRGIIGQTITPELIINFASAFGTMVPVGSLLVGRDSRNSSPMVADGVISALLATGHEVIDLGLCPTPIIQFLVKNKRARGAVSVTAGHNPAPWNALNFINSQGTYLNEFQGQELLDIYHLGRFKQSPLKKAPKIIRELNPEEPYLEWLLGRLDLAPIKRAKFKIVVDPTNGAGSKLIDKLFSLLGVRLIAINNEGNGYFPHDPEPRPRNAIEVASLVKITTADIGFLLNSDASRLSLVSEDGETLSEEYTLPLIARYYLKKYPGPVVTNLSTSMMIDVVAREQKLPVIRTRVGQSAIVQAMLEEKASLAGEGSGGL
ncbi:MAG TPA: phosphoglucosamine mutase, partial [Candidatus Saccharicenans sp.]|nr:phosphoglucosamine mutase [Candidatus Saccharicenans sp.]